MRINPKIYHAADGKEAIDVQKLEDERVIEIYSMDDFEDIYNEYTSQSKFYVWSSEDGINYRIYVENGYYEGLKDLYSANINKVWLDFWDECEKIGNKFSKQIIMPLTLLCVIIYLIGVSVWHWKLWICILILGTFLVLIMFLNRLSKKKISDVNVKSVAEIKKYLGEKHFNELLEFQRGYADAFYERKYPDELDDEDKDNSLEEKENSTDVKENEDKKNEEN